MVSKSLRARLRRYDESFRKRTAWPPVACMPFQLNAGPTGLGPREAAERVWSIASGGNHSMRRRRATVSSLPAADTHLHANAPRRARRKNSTFSSADTHRRASPHLFLPRHAPRTPRAGAHERIDSFHAAAAQRARFRSVGDRHRRRRRRHSKIRLLQAQEGG